MNRRARKDQESQERVQKAARRAGEEFANETKSCVNS